MSPPDYSPHQFTAPAMMHSPRLATESRKDVSGNVDHPPSQVMELVEFDEHLTLPENAGNSRAGSSTDMRNGKFASPLGYHVDSGRSAPFPEVSPRKFMMGGELSPKADLASKPPLPTDPFPGLSRRHDTTFDMQNARMRRQVNQSPSYPAPRSISLDPMGRREKPPGIVVREFAPSPVASRRTHSVERQTHTRVSSFTAPQSEQGPRYPGSPGGMGGGGGGMLPKLFTKRRLPPEDPYGLPRRNAPRATGKLVFKSLMKEDENGGGSGGGSRPSSIKATTKPKHVRFQNVQKSESSRPSSIGTIESKERQGPNNGSNNVTPVPSRQASAARFGNSRQGTSTPGNSRPTSTAAGVIQDGIPQEALEKMDISTLHLLARRTKGPAKFRYLAALMHKHNETKDYLM